MGKTSVIIFEVLFILSFESFLHILPFLLREFSCFCYVLINAFKRYSCQVFLTPWAYSRAPFKCVVVAGFFSFEAVEIHPFRMIVLEDDYS